MRWVVGLLASSARPRHPASTAFFDSKQSQPLETEELEALAGVWSTTLDLDDGARRVSLHLDKNGHVNTADASLPFNICHGETSTSATWTASAVPESDKFKIKLQLGVLYLEGKGKRKGLRCSTMRGSVLEGGSEPCCVGGFEMRMSLPTTSDVTKLQERHQARIDARPAPPLSFARSSFVGRWRLLLAIDDDGPPAYFTIRMDADRTFTSEGSEQTIAGYWGMYARDSHSASGWSAIQPNGSSLWLKVLRDRSSETLRGLADLPVRNDFNLWGKPSVDSIEGELAARAGEGTSDRVDGRLWVGAVERAYFGRFSLLRGSPLDGGGAQ